MIFTHFWKVDFTQKFTEKSAEGEREAEKRALHPKMQ